jgi:spermidine synthase
MHGIPFVALGAVSLLLQITVLRELLTVFSGNELDIGITLSLWLVSVGAGSFTGSRIRFKNAFGYSFLLVCFLIFPTLMGIKLIRPVLSLAPGEAASLGATFLSTAAVLFPLCFSLGLQFPLAVSAKGGREPAASVYALEAAGAFLGGVLFTFVLSGRVGHEGLALSLGVLNVLVASYVLRVRAVVLFVAVPVGLYAGSGGAEKYLGKRSGIETVSSVQSRYGEITVTRLEGQLNVYQAGHLLFSYPDPQTEELGVHLPMAAYPGEAPRKVLVIGGSLGTLREFLKYPVRGVDYVEIDPVLVQTSLDMLDEADSRTLRDGRVGIITEDGRKFVKSLDSPAYDMVVMNLGEPSTANMNRFYTVEFFRELKRVMKEGAMFTLTLPPSSGYVGRRMQLANGSIYNSLSDVFGHVEVSTEEYGLLMASERPVDLAPEALKQRFSESGISTRHFRPYIIDDAFLPLRRDLFRGRIGAVEEKNTDLRPAAYLYNLMLWAEMHKAGVLNAVLGLGRYSAAVLILAFAVYAGAVFRRRKRILYYSMMGAGYAGMAFMLAILLSFQASFGYVYEMFGLLSAVFMAGMALGSHLMRGRGFLKTLFGLELATAAIALSAPLFFGAEIMFYCISLLAGTVTGAVFASVNTCMRASDPGAAGGRLYAMDLLGSFLGAFLAAVVFIPVMGIRETLYLVAAVKMLSAILVWFIRNEQG